VGAGVAAGDDVVGLAADAAGDATAAALDLGLGLVACHGGEFASQDEGLAGERAPFDPRERGRLDGGVDARGEKTLDHPTVLRLGEEIGDGAAADLPETRNGLQGLGRCFEKLADVRETRGELARHGLAHQADAERGIKSIQGAGLALFDLLDDLPRDFHSHLVCLFSNHSVQVGDLLGGQLVEIGEVADEAALHELPDQLLAQAADVHGGPRRIVQDAGLDLGGAGGVLANPGGLAGLAEDGATARRAFGGELEFDLVSGAGVLDDGDDLGDDVAGAADDDAVADAHVLAPKLVLVVQGGAGNDHAADVDGLQDGDGGEDAGAADVDLDVSDDGDLLLRRELAGDGPARAAGALAEGVAEAIVVDLHADAVDEVRQLVSPLQQGAPVGVDLLHRLGAPAIGGEAKAKAGQPLHAFAVQRELRRAAEDLVGIEDEGTGSGD